MNLIEQLGGYEAAKKIAENTPPEEIHQTEFFDEHGNYYANDCGDLVVWGGYGWLGVEGNCPTLHCIDYLIYILLQYRRQHNIFEVGDKVYGVGVNDRSRPAYFNNKATKEYDHWVGMLERCYGQNKHIKSRPTYESCECSENFKSYSYFYDWCQSQVGFKNSEWQLDKYILIEGNKLYSEDTCVFVPCDINNFLTNRKKQNRSGYTGVSFHKASGKYAAQISFGGKRKHLGLFENPQDGENFYLLVKRRMAIELIEKYKSNLDERVVDALLSKYKPEEIKAGKRLEVD